MKFETCGTRGDPSASVWSGILQRATPLSSRGPDGPGPAKEASGRRRAIGHRRRRTRGRRPTTGCVAPAVAARSCTQGSGLSRRPLPGNENASVVHVRLVALDLDETVLLEDTLRGDVPPFRVRERNQRTARRGVLKSELRCSFGSSRPSQLTGRSTKHASSCCSSGRGTKACPSSTATSSPLLKPDTALRRGGG